MPTNGRAIIFGSGLGYDLPLRQLKNHFSEVLLVDLVHTLPIKAQAFGRAVGDGTARAGDASHTGCVDDYAAHAGFE